MDFYKGTIPIIDDTPEARDFALPNKIDGTKVGYGYVPRDLKAQPYGSVFESPSTMELIPKSEWDARYEEEEKQQSSLEHMYLSMSGGRPVFENLDQNGHGYCWAYSTGHSIMICRLRDNYDLVRLNPHSVAAIIKKGADQGGWCGLSAKFACDVGYGEEGNGPGQWPLHSRDLKYDTPELRTRMARYRISEHFIDLSKAAYDHQLDDLQRATASFNRWPGPEDYGWWGHSVCRIRWVRIEAGSWGPLILNSWKGWGRFGLAVLRGDKARTMGALCLRTVTPSSMLIASASQELTIGQLLGL